MSSNVQPPSDPYSLARGAAAVRRLHALHDVYSPSGRRVLLQAGLREGMRVADFGCGVGAVTSMLAEMVGPSGSVTGIDVSAEQLEQAIALCARQKFGNISFVEANACSTGLPRDWFDLVYCRFLLLHLPHPSSCLREMQDVLKPGGILVVEDADLTSAASIPPTAIHAFSDLFGRLGPARGLDYSMSKNLYHLVQGAGFSDVNLEIHQPVIIRGESRFLLKWTLEEAEPALVEAGLVTSDQLARILAEMQEAIDDPNVLILAPPSSLVWARRSVC